MASSSASESHDEEFVIVREANATNNETTLIPRAPASQTVKELKEAIANEKESDWNVISLAFGRDWLADNDRTLSSYQIENGNEVICIRSVTSESNSLEKMIKNLFFKDFNGRMFNLAGVPSSWAVSALQKRVGMERGYDPNTLRLLWSGRSLESGEYSVHCLTDEGWRCLVNTPPDQRRVLCKTIFPKSLVGPFSPPKLTIEV